MVINRDLTHLSNKKWNFGLFCWLFMELSVFFSGIEFSIGNPVIP